MTHLFEKRVMAGEAKGFDPKTRRFKAIASKEIVDRDGEIVRVKAFEKRLDSFRKNPVLLWSHDPFQPPIGKVHDIGVVGDELQFEGELRPAEDSPLMADIHSAVEGGFLKAFSVGFRAFEILPSKSGVPRQITDAELFEISLVCVPANSEAVMKCSKMLQTITAHGTEVEDKFKVLFGAPTDLDVLRRAARIIERIDDELSKGLVLPEGLAEGADELALCLWTRGERLAEDRRIAEILDSLTKQVQT